jgi:hypothetical protein
VVECLPSKLEALSANPGMMTDLWTELLHRQW